MNHASRLPPFAPPYEPEIAFATRRLDVDVPEWRRLGLPITREEKEATI